MKYINNIYITEDPQYFVNILSIFLICNYYNLIRNTFYVTLIADQNFCKIGSNKQYKKPG